MFSNITFLLLMFMGCIVLIWGMYLLQKKKSLESYEEGAFFSIDKNTLSEAETIRYAAFSEGKLSVASLCMKADVTTEVAQEMLEQLQEKGVFDVEVSEQGNVYYVLRDKDIIHKKKK